MANKNIKEVEGGAVTSLNDSDALEIDTGSASYYILWQDVKLLMATAMRGSFDYKIVPSVSSNNLSLDIQRFDGTAVSSTYPLKFRVGGSNYTLTTSPSFTKNAGTNWANAGASETAAQAIDWFVYAIGETGASAGLKFGYSRIPYAQTMNDFSSTTTNEKYILGNYTNFNTTDAVVNIGRFRATLGASASYNWSIATSVVLNYPVYETDVLSYTPTWSASGVAPAIGNGTLTGTYQVTGRNLICDITHIMGSTTTFGTAAYSWSIPFTPATNLPMACYALDSGTAHFTGTAFGSGASALIAVATSGNTSTWGQTLPMTWANGDTAYIRSHRRF